MFTKWCTLLDKRCLFGSWCLLHVGHLRYAFRSKGAFVIRSEVTLLGLFPCTFYSDLDLQCIVRVHNNCFKVEVEIFPWVSFIYVIILSNVCLMI